MIRSLLLLALCGVCASASAQGGPPPFPDGPPPVGSGVAVGVKVVLGGAYSGTTMRTDLFDDDRLPTSQPYGADIFDGTALEYDGLEDAAGYLATAMGVVDWVLVELRTAATSAPTARAAALVLANGTVVRADGQAGALLTAAPGSYFVVVRHRNHLPVMSATTVDLSSGSATIDFTVSGAAFSNGGAAQAALEGGGFGMWGGDGSLDGRLTVGDPNLVWLPDNGTTGYRLSDFNLNGRVTVSDPNITWLPGNGRSAQVPAAE